jgi:hypothetical protein
MHWELLGMLGQQDPADLEPSRWLYEVKRGSERRQVEVLITSPAKHSPTVRYDVERDGESALLQVLQEIGDGEPPKRITITAEGIERSWEHGIEARLEDE